MKRATAENPRDVSNDDHRKYPKDYPFFTLAKKFSLNHIRKNTTLVNKAKQ